MAAARIVWYFLVGFSLHAAIAPPSQYEGRPVQQVRFEPPTQPVLRSELNRLLPFHDGTPLRLNDVRAAIKQLYATGLYANIEMSVEPAPNGVVLVIRTVEQWFVGPVEVHGKVHEPPNTGQLANASRLELGTPFEDTEVDSAVKGLKQTFERNGLYLSKVDPQVDRDAEHQQVAVTFQVDAGKRARLAAPVINGNTVLDMSKLIKAAKYKGWFRWKPATEDNVQHGVSNVRRQYEKNERLTSRVTLTGSNYLAAENRVQPVMEADGGPKIKLTSEGAKISQSDLQKYVPVFDEQNVNRDLLVRGLANLRDYFQNKGYFDVQVDFRTTNPSPDQEQITYLVDLGERHKLVQVNVTGNRYFTVKDIRERMFLQPSGFIRLRHGRYSEGFASRDKDAITALYQDNGFQDVQVTITPNDNYQGKKGDVAVIVAIDEGPQYHVAAVNLAGVTKQDPKRLTAQIASTPGQPYSKNNVALDRDYILGIYQSEGYPDANFDWRLTPGPGPQEVTLTYQVNEGQPRFVRDVLISGLHATNQRLINPNILLKTGDPLSWTQMGRMQRRLYNLGVFDKVDMAIQNPDGDTENKYVLFHVTEGHRYYMAVGLGAELARIGGSQSSLSSPQGATGFSPRVSFDISRLNMFGLGHSLNFKSRYSTLDRRVSLNYLAPRINNIDNLNLSITALYDNSRDVRTFTARRLEGNLQLSQRLSRATTFLYRYSWRNVQVDQNTLKITPFAIPALSQPARIGMLSFSLIQDRRDDATDAHRGIYNTLDLGLAEHVLGGNKNFARFLGRNSYYKTIHGNLVLASNTQFGVIHAFNVPNDTLVSDYIPLPERFFAGGTASHRGFPDNQAGPRDPITGFPLGGNVVLFHSTELRFPFIGDNISGVFFHDIGNVYSGFSHISFRFRQRDDTDFDYAVHAVGFGVRYRTPLGPVRVDLAYSVNPPAFVGFNGSFIDLINAGVNPCESAPGVPSKCVRQRVSHFQFFFSIGQAF